jgi:hypothetical protein
LNMSPEANKQVIKQSTTDDTTSTTTTIPHE